MPSFPSFDQLTKSSSIIDMISAMDGVARVLVHITEYIADDGRSDMSCMEMFGCVWATVFCDRDLSGKGIQITKIIAKRTDLSAHVDPDVRIERDVDIDSFLFDCLETE